MPVNAPIVIYALRLFIVACLQVQCLPDRLCVSIISMDQRQGMCLCFEHGSASYEPQSVCGENAFSARPDREALPRLTARVNVVNTKGHEHGRGKTSYMRRQRKRLDRRATVHVQLFADAIEESTC